MFKYARVFSVRGRDCYLIYDGGFREAWRIAYRDLRMWHRRGLFVSDTVVIIGNKLGGGGMWIIHDTVNGLTCECCK